MKLLFFELKKVLFSKTFLYMILGIVLAISFLLLRNIMLESQIEEEERLKIDNFLETSFTNSKIHQARLERNPDDMFEKNLLFINASMVNTLYKLRSAISSDDWQSKLMLEIDFLKLTAKYKEDGGIHPLNDTEISHSLALNQKLLDENIPLEHKIYSTALPNFMKLIVDFFANFGAILIVIVLLGEMMSSEFENHSIHLLFTQPLKRTNIITSKLLSSIILFVLTTFIMLLAVVVIGLVLGEKGTFQYPLVTEINNTIRMMAISEYIIKAITVTTATILMIVSLCLLYSLFLKHTLATLFVLLGTLLLGYALMSYIPGSLSSWFNPFQYLFPEKIITFQNDSVWYQGIPIILVLTVVFYLIATEKIKKVRLNKI